MSFLDKHLRLRLRFAIPPNDTRSRVLCTAGAWEFVVAEATSGLSGGNQLRRRRAAVSPAHARSARELGPGTPKYRLSMAT